VKIRKSHHDDIEQISELLASASHVTDDNDNRNLQKILNWNSSIKILQAKSSLRTQLLHRINAVKEGAYAFSRASQYLKEQISLSQDLALDSVLQLKPRYVWSHDKFRNSLEAAGKSAAEEYAWNTHNFAMAPDDLSLLQHLMISAEDVTTGKIVGFCEVAMLPVPFNQGIEEVSCVVDYNGQQYSPVIANLVIAPSVRRNGIGSNLVNTAIRFTRRFYSSKNNIKTLGLYVDKRNSVAIAMYTKEGFKLRCQSRSHTNQWYMQKIL